MRDKKLKKIVDYAYNSVPFYVCLKEKTQTQDTIIEKSMIDDIGEFIAFQNVYGKNENIVRMETSGSTGKCMEILWDKHDYTSSLLSLWLYRYKYYNIRTDDKFCYFYTLGNVNDTIDDNVFYEETKNALGFSKSNLSDRRMFEICTMIKKFNPVWINTQPSMALLLAEFFKKHKLGKIDNLRYIELTGEMLLESTRNLIENVFGCKVANQYGCIEANSIAYECPYGNMHCMEDNIYVEIVDERGEIISDDNVEGNIVITTLNSRIMPFIRYKIGDMGIIEKNKKCKCGNCSPILKLTSGRTSDFAIMRDGSRVSSYVFVRAVELVNRRYENVIRQFRVTQKDYEYFVVSLVLDEDTIAVIGEREVEDVFLQSINDERLYETEFEFEYYDELTLEKGERKLKYFIREIE